MLWFGTAVFAAAPARADGPATADALRFDTAIGDPRGTLRAGVNANFFRSTGFLVAGDTDARLQGALTLGYTALPWLDLFGAFGSSTNHNDFDKRTPGIPPTLSAAGDVTLALRARRAFLPGFYGGFVTGVKLLTGVGSFGWDLNATSLWFGPTGTIDLQALRQIPLRLHGRADYYVDNSQQLFSNPYTATQKFVVQFANDVAKSRAEFGLSADLPLPALANGVALLPFVAYNVTVVTASADPAFAPSNVSCANSACDTNRDQHRFTVGLRAQLTPAASVEAAVDIRARSVAPEYGPPLPPYLIRAGFSYAFDTLPPPRAPAPASALAVPVEPPPPTTGSLVVTVTSTLLAAPIENAIVTVGGPEPIRFATDAKGVLRATLPLGKVDLAIAAAEFDPATQPVTIVAGSPTTVAVQLQPRAPSGKVHGRIVDDADHPVAAVVHLVGPDVREIKADADGVVAGVLPVGSYRARIDAEGFLSVGQAFEITKGSEQAIDAHLRPRPAKAQVSVVGKAFVLGTRIGFVDKSTAIDPMSLGILDQLVDFLLAHPEYKRVRIEAHWDKSLPKDKALALTDGQAKALRDYLVAHGLESARFEAVGVGSAPAKTGGGTAMARILAAGRGATRRVDLLILD